MAEHKLELLAPAGDVTCLHAAVRAGANAVYLGAQEFNARRGAGNFTLDALQDACHYAHLRGEKTSTNPVATIYAWTGALRKRGELDELPELVAFADKLEKATIDTIESGVMTGDLYLLSSLENKQKVSTEAFLDAVHDKLAQIA